MKILEELKKRKLYFDGGTGTVLQSMGLKPGEKPETWNIEKPELITELHRQYFKAGANIVKTNTFGLNRFKFDNVEKYAKAAVECAKTAASEFENKFVAFDIGPTGKLLEPIGELPFEEAVSAFAEVAVCAERYGADLILIETMNDSYETKAAVLAAKENTSLPIFVTNVYDETGKLMTGADAHAMIALLEGLGVDAVGMNCSLGPDKMIPVVKEFARYSSLPIIVNPNAGLPSIVNGKTVYDLNSEDFAEKMKEIASLGATVLGGCCGTTPEYIEKMIKRVNSVPFSYPERKKETVVSSYTHAVTFGDKPVLIGERINPTGKKKIKEALRNKEYGVIFSEGVKQADAGAHILDVNAGLPEIDEADAISHIVSGLQGITDLPLQIDTTNPEAMEKAMRIYNGKPLVNSVNGGEESMKNVFPLVQKYGGTLIALTIDENGIPETAQGRCDIAEKIIREAAKYGIEKKDIIVDPLALTVSSDSKSASVTLESIELIKKKLGVATSLGVSNISFGLPDRETINSVFFAMALERGLDAAIMNPFSEGMMKAYYSYKTLSSKDENCAEYISFATSSAQEKEEKSAAEKTDISLTEAIIKGLTETAKAKTSELLRSEKPMSVIDNSIIPALNEVGTRFEQKKAFLPQLLMSAEAASASFEVIKAAMPSSADDTKKIVLATVKGDIHDIGKNIVKVLLENFGFKVNDLGRDTDPELVAREAVGCKLVGLSALMTTTVPAMEETIKLIRKSSPETKVVVGGAVLTQEYADMIGADFYAADAMETVRIAQEIFGEK